MERLAICYLVKRIGIGGSVSLVDRRIAQIRSSFGDQIRIGVCAFVESRGDVAAAAIEARWARQGVTTNVLGYRPRGGNLRTIRNLWRVSSQYDVIHLLNAPPAQTLVGAMSARRPLVVEWVTDLPQAGRKRRLVARLAAMNLAVSETVAARIPSENVTVVRPPLDLAFASGAVRPADLDPLVRERFPIILFVSRLSREKGVGHLVPIATRVVQELPSALFLVAGDGELRSELERDIVRAGLAGHVRLLGPRADVANLHVVADIYLSTSEVEGLVGYSTLEAALSGTPIVATDIPSVREILRNGRDALLVRPGDAAEASEAVVRLAGDPQLARSLSEAARETVLQAFDSAHATADLVNLYRRIVSV